MKYLFDDWDKIAAAARTFFHILLLLDYDGTTVPIQRAPEKARLDEETRQLLRKLSGHPKVTLGIISGRSISDIASMVGLNGLIYTGNHGLEIWLPGKPVERLYGEETLQVIRNIQKELKGQLGDIKGVLIEDKGPIMAIHYRMARGDTNEVILKAVRGLVSKNPGLAMRQGKMVVEITPDIPFNKGMTVKWLLDNLFPEERPIVVFAGDDLTDEDAFAMLDEGDVSIYVGLRPNHFSARYYTKDSSGIRQFLYELENVLNVS
ncbi:MAG: trehalose-phosphatase [Candidatus Brocadiales bacterium]